MTDNISGVENETVKSCQPVHSFGASLLEESESALMHPIDTIERAGSAAIHGIERVGSGALHGVEKVGSGALHGVEKVGSGALHGVEKVGSGALHGVERVGSGALHGVERVGSGALHGVEKVGSGTYDALKSGVSYVEKSAENLYGKVMGNNTDDHTIVLNQGGETNLDKLNQHMEAIQRPQPVASPIVRSRVRNISKTIINWIILLLVLLLIGVIIYLTCKRYSLVGTALNTGDRTMAAALLSPELSTGLSTLAAVL
jgi:hypothetical protein